MTGTDTFFRERLDAFLDFLVEISDKKFIKRKGQVKIDNFILEHRNKVNEQLNKLKEDINK